MKIQDILNGLNPTDIITDADGERWKVSEICSDEDTGDWSMIGNEIWSRDRVVKPTLYGTVSEPCKTCEGSGRVTVTNTVKVDSGSVWARSADEEVNTECPTCNGEG